MTAAAHPFDVEPVGPRIAEMVVPFDLSAMHEASRADLWSGELPGLEGPTNGNVSLEVIRVRGVSFSVRLPVSAKATAVP